MLKKLYRLFFQRTIKITMWDPMNFEMDQLHKKITKRDSTIVTKINKK